MRAQSTCQIRNVVDENKNTQDDGGGESTTAGAQRRAHGGNYRQVDVEVEDVAQEEQEVHVRHRRDERLVTRSRGAEVLAHPLGGLRVGRPILDGESLRRDITEIRSRQDASESAAEIPPRC